MQCNIKQTNQKKKKHNFYPPKKKNNKKGCTINFPQLIHSIVSIIRRLYFLLPRPGINLVIILTLALFAYQNLFCSPSVINSILTQVKLNGPQQLCPLKKSVGKKNKLQLNMAAQQVVWQTKRLQELAFGPLMKKNGVCRFSVCHLIEYSVFVGRFKTNVLAAEKKIIKVRGWHSP